MKRATLGILVVAGLVMAAAAAAQQRGVPVAPAPTAGVELVVVPTVLGEKIQMLTVVDPRQLAVAV